MIIDLFLHYDFISKILLEAFPVLSIKLGQQSSFLEYHALYNHLLDIRDVLSVSIHHE